MTTMFQGIVINLYVDVYVKVVKLCWLYKFGYIEGGLCMWYLLEVFMII